VNAFAVAATALLAGFVPIGIVAMRARPIDGVVALQLAGAVATLVLLCLAEAFHRSFNFTVPVVAAVLTWVGGLVYARFFGRWL